MKKIIVYLILIFALLFQSKLYSQYYTPWDVQNIGYNTTKLKFINENTGYLAIHHPSAISSENKSYLVKTTNRGLNWNGIWNGTYDIKFTYEIIGSNLNVYHQMKVDHSTNEGQSWYGNSFNMSGIVGTAPSEQLILKFFNQSTGYLTYVNSDNPYPTLFIFKTNDGGNSWALVFSKTGNDNAKYKFSINDFAFIGNDANHVFFGGYIAPINNLNQKGYITIETTNGFYNGEHSYGSVGGGSEDCLCINSVSVLPNSPDQKRIILSKYKYSNYNYPDNGIYCKVDNLDYKIGNVFEPEQYGGVSFSDNNIGYSYIYNEIYKTSNSGVNWVLVKNELPDANYCKFRINTFGDIVYAFSNGGDFISKFISSSINTVSEFQVGFNGYFTLNGESINTPFNYYIKGGINSFSANTSENKMFYKWSDGNMINNREIDVLNDNFNLVANYKTLEKADNQYAIANPNQTKIYRDTNGTINRIYESMGGIFYSRMTNNGISFSTEEIVNSESDGNKNAFISEVKHTVVTPIDPNANVAAVWQRREGNNEIIKFSYRDGQSSLYYWIRESAFNITVPSTNQFNLQPKCFIQKRSAMVGDFFSFITYLKPNGTNIDLMVTAKANLGATPDNFTIASGNISEYAVTRICDGTYQILFFTYIKGNEVYFKCYKYAWYSMPYPHVAQTTDPNNPDFTVSANPPDGQLTRITPDISLRNGRPIVTYRAKSVIQRCVQAETNEDFYYSFWNYPIFVRYKYYSSNEGEIWSTRVIYNSAGVEQTEPNVEGCKNGDAYVLNYKYNNLYKQTAYLQYSPGYCNPGQYSLTDAKLVRGSFYGTSYPYSSPMLLTLNQSGSLYNVSKEIFTVSNTRIANLTVMDNLVGTIREQNVNYNFALGPVIVKNTNITFMGAAETSVTNSIEFSNTMVSAPFSLGPTDTLILNGQGYYNYKSGNPFLQKRFTVNLMRKSSQGIFMPLFSGAINATDTIETEYLRGFIFSSDNIPQVDSFYVQLFIDSTSLYQGDLDYGISNAYSPDEASENGDNSHTLKKAVHFKNVNNLSNVINSVPKTYELSQNYPNPFNPVTNIKYQLPKDGLVTLKVYDITGREIAKLVNEVKQAGFYTASFNGSNFASGVYFYRIQSGDFIQVKRMVLIK